MEANSNTPRARPPLRFANRAYEFTASPHSPARRLGTPQQAHASSFASASASARGGKLFARDELPKSGLSASSISAARNIFRASSITNTPTAPQSHAFSPQIPPSTMKKVFAPGATPDPKRLFRDSVARPSPRGMAAKTTSSDLFQMRIPSPPPELTGESLMNDIPENFKSKGTVYADQYLSHLCPPEFDDLQRRQFFCILDLRRLKFSANEIFAKKDWKLNIMNFAKEFEKSRSLIMLRYGLYEFKNVKPSEEIMKKWRAAHGLPEPEEDATVDTPLRSNGTKTNSTKRKAEEELTKEAPLSTSSANKNKRRAADREEEAPVATPAAKKNKRKASVSDEPDENQPTKLQRSTPSATKSLFEKIVNNVSAPTPPRPSTKPPQFGSTLAPTTIFAPTPRSVTNGGSATGSILDGIKPGTPQPQYGQDNLFSHLSDVSAQNSGVEADGESEPDSSEEAEETQETGGRSYEPSVAASGRTDTPSSLPGTSFPMAKKVQFSGGLTTGPSSTSSEARESTPNRSLFDRVTKGRDGQPVRLFGEESQEPSPAVEKAAEPVAVEPPKPAPVSSVWTPGTPIKFGGNAPAMPAGGLFGASTSQAGSVFAKAPTAASSIFGAPKQDKPAEPSAPATEPAKPVAEADKSGGESDKENTTRPAPTKALFGPFGKTSESSGALSSAPKPAAESKAETTPKPLFGATTQPSPFQAKPADENKEPEAATKPAAAPALFGSVAKPSEAKPAPSLAPSASSVFGSKPAAPAASPFQSSTLFGAPKSAEPLQQPAAADQPKPTPAFGSAAATGNTSIFGAQTTSNAGGMFGSAPPSKPLFSVPAASTESKDPVKPAGSPAAGPMFQFGGAAKPTTTSEAPKPLFGAAQPAAAAAAPKPLFGALPATPAASAKRGLDGSPMKQDEPSPAKKLFGGPSSGLAAPTFSFGGGQNAAPANPFASGPSAPSAPSGPVMFGSGAAGGPAFTFSAGGGPTEGVRNPFASAGSDSGSTAGATTGSMFNFSAGGPPAPAAGAGAATPFVFGAGNASSASAGGAVAGSNPFLFNAGSGPKPGTKPNASATSGPGTSLFNFGANGSAGQPAASSQPHKPLFGAATSAPGFSFTAASPQPPVNGTATSIFGPKPNPPAASMFAGALQPGGGASTTGTNSPFNFGGASSLATTPAAGTPEPERSEGATGAATGASAADGDAEPAHEQISLTEGGPGEEDETVLHEVRAKVLKFVPPGHGSDGEDGGDAKSKSPWTTKGVGPFRILKHKATGGVRILLRAEPRGHVALNRSLLPDMKYKAEEKYVKLTTASEDGSGLETWMVQVKTKELAVALAVALEENKGANKK